MSPADLAISIDMYLRLAGGWVSVERVCSDCGLAERLLRADGRRRPIYSRFAISSSTKGLKHIIHTTARERIKYQNSRKKVLIANLRAIRDFKLAVADATTGKFPLQFERLTGQAILFPL